MKKVVVLLLCIIAYVMWWGTLPSARPSINDAPTAQSPQVSIEGITQKIAATFLPAEANWPRPLRILWQASHIKTTAYAAIPRDDWVPLKAIPKNLQQGIISVEDRRFYEHYGVDMDGIIRALLVNILLDSEQSMERKAFEAFLALWIEAQNSKEDILEIYLNTTYFGAGATGIKEATQVYFGVIPAQLTLAESATLAGLPNAPSALNPFENPIGCKRRRDLVLDLMAKYGYINLADARTASETPLILDDKAK